VSVRGTRWSTTAVGIVLAAAITAGINYLSARHWSRGDWTRTKIYSLSETTRKVVRSLSKPVSMTVFMGSGNRLSAPVTELANRYRSLSSKITVEFVDPRREPVRAEGLAREFGLRDGTVLLRSGQKKKYVEQDKMADFDFANAGLRGQPEIKAFKAEEAFTSAILDVTEDRVTRVYFSTGHGEPSLDSTAEGRGFSQLKQVLTRDNVTVAPWDSGKGRVPEDATVLVIGGPRTAFAPPEAAALTQYAAKGGKILILLDPMLPTPGAPPTDLGLKDFLAGYGIKLNDDIVVDPANAVPLVGAETVIANHFGTHPIVRPLSEEGLPLLFPIARSVAKITPAPAGWTDTMLVETTTQGWGETDLEHLDNVQKDARDNAGPVTIAMAVSPADEKKAGGHPMRLVVVGNSRFATNGNLGSAGNASFFVNALHWLEGEEKLIGIAPKTPAQSSLNMTQSQVNRLGLFSMFGLPLLSVALGVWVWYRRRD
jgi:gliding motility-associatede transport system auxiliary component